MITQKEFVRQAYDRYYALGLEPGNKDHGSWEKAHYPLPQPEGNRWIWLLRDDHLLQGVLQSEEFGRCCFFSGHVKPFLKNHWCDDWFEISALYEKWQAIQASEAGKIGGPKGGRNQSREDKSKGGKITGKTTFENGTGLFGQSEEEWFEARSKGGRNVSGEDKSNGGKTSTSLTYISTVTGFVSNPAVVAIHNQSQGHPKDAKAKVPDELLDIVVRTGRLARIPRSERQAADLQNALNLEAYECWYSLIGCHA